MRGDRLVYSAARIRRHVTWLRADGIRRLVEEDDLDAIERLRTYSQRRAWRRSGNSERGCAAPVLVVGVQRSGTNMVIRALRAAPEVDTYNENDRRAFRRFELRPDVDLRAIVARSPYRIVAFKPLCDSHRTGELLDGLRVQEPGKAVWVYRDVDSRARSAVRKFGSANLDALRRVAAGETHIWQAGGVGSNERDLLRSFDYSRLTAVDAAALFWYMRNSLFFTQRLDVRDDVLLVRYEDIVRQPAPFLRTMCDFLGVRWRPDIAMHVDGRNAGGHSPLDIDGRVRALCDSLTARLDSSAIVHSPAGITTPPHLVPQPCPGG